MRIVGEIDPETKMGFVQATLTAEEPAIRIPIRLLVDTGCEVTTIADTDAHRIGLDYDVLPPAPYGSVGIGERRIPTFLLRNCALTFDVLANTALTEYLEVIHVLRHDPKNSEEQEIVDSMPSILGLDVLKRFVITFRANSIVIER